MHGEIDEKDQDPILEQVTRNQYIEGANWRVTKIPTVNRRENAEIKIIIAGEDIR